VVLPCRIVSRQKNLKTSSIYAKGKDLDMLTEIAKESKKANLLDIGTGGGHVANALAPFFEKVTALDLTPRMLEKAKEFIKGNGHTNVSFVQGTQNHYLSPTKYLILYHAE
jgi:ubiquinone/menaquinone biosynthesis C-methylase UbiE